MGDFCSTNSCQELFKFAQSGQTGWVSNKQITKPTSTLLLRALNPDHGMQEISQMFFGKISSEAYPNGGFSECRGQPSLEYLLFYSD